MSEVLSANDTAPKAPPLPPQKGLLSRVVRLSPLNQRRLANFKANRRGYWSFWIFMILFVLSLFAEFLANDRPVIARYKGEWLFPVLVDYPEEKFGGFLAVTDYRDPVIAQEIRANGFMVFPPIRFHHRTIQRDLPLPAPSPPTWKLTDEQCAGVARKRGGTGCGDIEWNWLGTDDRGRDVAARLIYGFRISVLFGLILTIASSVIGIAAGAVQGYYGGKIDLIGQRFIEIWTSMPMLFLLIILSAVITPSFLVLLGIVLLFKWTTLDGVVRAEFLRARNFEYVKAARALGLTDRQIMVRHMLPNAMVATLTYLPFVVNASITTLTSLDYLGFGLPPGSPSLGELLQQGKSNLQAPWLAISGFMVIATMLSLLIFIGEAVRDAFDPRKSFA